MPMTTYLKRSTLDLLTLALLGSVVTLAAPARADEAACIAASETETALRNAGKLQDALKQLAICAAPTCSSEVKAECTKRIAEVKAALPTLVLRATDSAGNDVAAVNVTLDGAPFVSSLDGRPIALDVGTHTLRFQATGKNPVEKTLVVGEGEKDRHVTVMMAEAAGPTLTPGVALVAPALPAPLVPATPPAAEPVPSDASAHGGGVRTAGFVVGGIGVAGVLVGSILGGLAIAKVSSAKGECVPVNNCNANTNPAATNDMQTAGTFADASTGTLIAGGALAVGGLAMVLWGGAKKEGTAFHVAPTLMAHGGAVALGGVW
jgi:hypothetical protein